MTTIFAFFSVLLWLSVSTRASDKFSYYVGVGRHDITGPAAEVEMMGYASPFQITKGIHLRQWSRAFIFAEPSDKNKRIVFVNIDACMGTQIMKIEVVRKLKEKYGDLYTDDNVCISAIHTHSGPAGYFQYVLYEIMSLGFVNQTLYALVDGIVASIETAHNNMVEANLAINQGDLFNASINRSPTAYRLNPQIKDYKTDVDTTMTVLKMIATNGTELGMISWFAVHCTSMNNSNPLISSDNKGLASLMMEQNKDPGSLPGKAKFVAAFAQSNEGDVSPNTKGPKCIDTGKPCDTNHSTCPDEHGKERNWKCIAFGPGRDMFESTWIIGQKQYDKGKELYDEAKTVILGDDIRYVQRYRNFSNITINGTEKHTCPPAMGDSFAAGTTDGPGNFSCFIQNDTKGRPFWDIVGHILHDPSEEQRKCQHPKPILLDTGHLHKPYPWTPEIVPLQIMSIGQLVIVAVPGEFTTMSGRLLRNAVLKTINDSKKFPKDPIVVIAGLANTYSDYIATSYEYEQQRYEAGSTIFGPYTLDAYIQEYEKLANSLATGSKLPCGKKPPNYLHQQLPVRRPELRDSVPSGKKFGGINKDVDTSRSYKVNETVEVEFWAGNPRNDLMTERSFLEVNYKNGSKWILKYTDASWETKFSWEYKKSEVDCLIEEPFAGCPSIATIQWTVPPKAASGTYQIIHYGAYKDGDGVHQYKGYSSEFKVEV